MFGGIEAGGTKFVCAVGSSPEHLVMQHFPTTTPAETIARAAEFFAGHKELRSIGIASFGPLDLNPASKTFGHITSTPKTAWRNFDFAGEVARTTKLPVAIDTDVNGAALAEARWGAARGLDTFVYITVGTGIGGGGLVNGKVMHGLLHPEMGHLRVPHDREDDAYAGCCPFHGDCLEGLASGPALYARWGRAPETLPSEHPAWDLQAHYLALGIQNIICTLSPQRVILGGGVMQRAELFIAIRKKVQVLLNGYVTSAALLDGIDAYIVPPALGDRTGVLGALALARDLATA
jgi:fructokinase